MRDKPFWQISLQNLHREGTRILLKKFVCSSSRNVLNTRVELQESLRAIVCCFLPNVCCLCVAERGGTSIFLDPMFVQFVSGASTFGEGNAEQISGHVWIGPMCKQQAQNSLS